MISKPKKPNTVAEYIQAAPKEAQKKLKEMRQTIRDAAPDAEEGLKWGMPSFTQKRILVTYAAFKNHIGFYPTPSTLAAFKKDITKFKNASGSIQFPMDKPLPIALIKKITKFRIKEILDVDAKWKTSQMPDRTKRKASTG
jgi:uncharacterized protein YdhG (YjbR/CyaY superfamily)